MGAKSEANKGKSGKRPLGVNVHQGERVPFYSFYSGTRSDSSWEGWNVILLNEFKLSQRLESSEPMTQQEVNDLAAGALQVGTTSYKHGMPEMFGVSIDECMFVSTRVKDFLLANAPNDLHAVPASLLMDGRPGFVLTGVWFIQVTSVIDCFDTKRSVWKNYANGSGDGYYAKRIADASRVPAHVRVFRVKGHLSMFCRREFTEAIEDQNFQHATFYTADVGSSSIQFM
jgi:hypothetical protein